MIFLRKPTQKQKYAAGRLRCMARRVRVKRCEARYFGAVGFKRFVFACLLQKQMA